MRGSRRTATRGRDRVAALPELGPGPESTSAESASGGGLSGTGNSCDKAGVVIIQKMQAAQKATLGPPDDAVADEEIRAFQHFANSSLLR